MIKHLIRLLAVLGAAVAAASSWAASPNHATGTDGLLMIDKIGGHVTERPVMFQEVFATLYHRLGIDVRTATVDDPQGRPQYLVDSGIEPLRELI